jgi:hypothetical protein
MYVLVGCWDTIPRTTECCQDGVGADLSARICSRLTVKSLVFAGVRLTLPPNHKGHISRR